jgi:hypothetical protein
LGWTEGGDADGASGDGAINSRTSAPTATSEPQPSKQLAKSRLVAFALHPLAQDQIDPTEVSLAFRFQPSEDIVVNAERNL